MVIWKMDVCGSFVNYKYGHTEIPQLHLCKCITYTTYILIIMVLLSVPE